MHCHAYTLLMLCIENWYMFLYAWFWFTSYSQNSFSLTAASKDNIFINSTRGKLNELSICANNCPYVECCPLYSEIVSKIKIKRNDRNFRIFQKSTLILLGHKFRKNDAFIQFFTMKYGYKTQTIFCSFQFWTPPIVYYLKALKIHEATLERIDFFCTVHFE